ncbi:DUF3726 domain-containing protein [Halomonas sp. 18H]|nr:DUF3726 domain-containing protein [Halomonas sp. 18H]MCW4150307.1 DUF3726 domain-containing protein [Halomonas sp. 18H]
MKVSFNELQGLCRKAFSGIGFEEGDAADAADMVAWMQCHGFPAIDQLSRGLDYLLEEDPEALPTVVYQDGDLAVLDGHGQSVLRSISLATELGFAKARARGLSVVKIRRCHNRQLIMGYLSRLAGRGINITAFWRNSQEPLTEQVVGFRAGHSTPEVRIFAVRDVPEENEPNDGITLVMANHVELLPSLGADHDLDLLAHHSESGLMACRKQALLEGIEVDDVIWSHLKTLAHRILVESSDASRSGAGAGVNDND